MSDQLHAQATWPPEETEMGIGKKKLSCPCHESKHILSVLFGVNVSKEKWRFNPIIGREDLLGRAEV